MTRLKATAMGLGSRWIGSLVVLLVLLIGCHSQPTGRIQGYVEGEYIYVAAPFGGTLQKLSVERGVQVKEGDPLFSLDSDLERAVQQEAEQRLQQAQANLEDAKKGKRPSELQAIKTQLQQAQTALEFAEKEWSRLENANKLPGTVSAQDLDRARSNRDQARQRVAELEAELETAQLGARTDQVIAAEASVRAAEAALKQAHWTLGQKTRTAPEAGLVFDTLYREGEWVSAGRPIISLLPPGHVKVRAFVPEPRIAAVHLGDRLNVLVDGVAQPISGIVRFISPEAEYTPPVIYSRESREKLVFMIEIGFETDLAAGLHPGQPVDVQLPP